MTHLHNIISLLACEKHGIFFGTMHRSPLQTPQHQHHTYIHIFGAWRRFNLYLDIHFRHHVNTFPCTSLRHEPRRSYDSWLPKRTQHFLCLRVRFSDSFLLSCNSEGRVQKSACDEGRSFGLIYLTQVEMFPGRGTEVTPFISLATLLIECLGVLLDWLDWI